MIEEGDRYKHAAFLICHFGIIKGWWNESVGKTSTGYITPEFLSNQKPRLFGYNDLDYHIELGRFSINNYNEELFFKGKGELDQKILEVLRYELPVLKDMNIVFYDVVDVSDWLKEIAQKSKKIYIL